MACNESRYTVFCVELPTVKTTQLDHGPPHDVGDDFWWVLGRLYVLKGYLGVRRLMKYLFDLLFRNSYINNLYREATEFSSPAQAIIAYAYSYTMETCRFDHFCSSGTSGMWSPAHRRKARMPRLSSATEAKDFLANLSIETWYTTFSETKKDRPRNSFRRTEHWYRDGETRLAGFTLRPDYATRKHRKRP